MTKKDFLLESIIQAYIHSSEPIGSTALKDMYNITYSPATIRGYFKKLGDEGYLAQEHISSGRTPTTDALKEYWLRRLDFSMSGVDYQMIEYLAKELGLTVFIKQQLNDKLQRVLNIENLYMILEFDKFSITIKYSAPLHRFLDDMIGFEPTAIMKISKEVGATQLYDELVKITSNSAKNIINVKQFLKMAIECDLDDTIINKFLNGEILNNISDGIYFEELLPSGFIGINHSTKVIDTDINMFVIGHLSKDYEYFYKRIAA
ncbi:MAG: heat-shock protein [Campylobacteraceae bacterium]|jgi:heat-inducible transcriptional repressor|nr:heat-shock protein [Campylobacteraceae bacterium]MBT3883088.1 heat-shock protein [Campylobacteraceae bacterium]MBT4030183.1 heat-shock protein [Campylobacteraceae bacterium]MBT4178755.1 heat-shock protein [Campylobacteraceae bacterium]MBT4572719.1 heat-shock protein [Campylobacteraceae bacterium]